MAGTPLHFKNAVIYMGSGGAAVLLSRAAEVDINVDFDEARTLVFGDTWEGGLKGALRWSGNMAGEFDTAQTLGFDAATAGGSVKFYMYPTAASPTRYYYGNIFPKLSIRGAVGAKGTFSGSFSGDGQLATN